VTSISTSTPATPCPAVDATDTDPSTRVAALAARMTRSSPVPFFDRATPWLSHNQDLSAALVRVYLGLGLLAKGVFFLGHTAWLHDMTVAGHVPLASLALAHYIALAHIGGGLLLAVGLLTRIAALVQLPILIGAVFYLHWTEGLFSGGQGIEFAGLVLFLLLVFTVFGGGRWSVDERVFRRSKAAAA